MSGRDEMTALDLLREYAAQYRRARICTCTRCGIPYVIGASVHADAELCISCADGRSSICRTCGVVHHRVGRKIRDHYCSHDCYMAAVRAGHLNVVEIACWVCGKVVLRPRKWGATYCSQTCANLDLKRRRAAATNETPTYTIWTRTCETCGVEFQRRAQRGMSPRYCGSECARAARKKLCAIHGYYPARGTHVPEVQS